MTEQEFIEIGAAALYEEGAGAMRDTRSDMRAVLAAAYKAGFRPSWDKSRPAGECSRCMGSGNIQNGDSTLGDAQVTCFECGGTGINKQS